MKVVNKEENKLQRKVILAPQKEGCDVIPFIIKLLEKLSSSCEDKVHDICFFMLNSGFRFAEIIDLKLSDVNFITGTLTIGISKRNLPNKGKVNITLNHKSLKILEKIRDKYPIEK
jgi:integrase